QAQDNVRVVDQLSLLLSGAIGSLEAALLGCGFLVSAGFHDQWRKLNRVGAALRVRTGEATLHSDTDARPLEPLESRGTPARWLRAEWDRVFGTVLVIGALGVFILSCRSTADAVYTSDQVAYVTSGGLASLFLLAVGVWVFVLADLRDIDHQLIEIEAGFQGGMFEEPGRVLASGSVFGKGRPRGPLAAAAAVTAASVAVVVLGWAK